MKRMFFVLETFVRLGIGALFAWSAWFKIQDPALFASSVESYRILPECMVGIFSLFMPMLELLAGIGLVATKWSREAALLVAGMLLVFIVALAQAAVRGLDISCGCFDDDPETGTVAIAKALARDVALLLPAVWLLFRPGRWIWTREASA